MAKSVFLNIPNTYVDILGQYVSYIMKYYYIYYSQSLTIDRWPPLIKTRQSAALNQDPALGVEYVLNARSTTRSVT